MPDPRTAPRAAATVLVGGLLALGVAAPAPAAPTTKAILESCSEGNIPRGYSQHAYEQALKQMPPELAEYSDCSSLINKAELATATGGRGAGPGGSSGAGGGAAVAPPTPSEQHVLERAAHLARPVRVGGEAIHPGVVHVNIASALSTLPTSLMALLALLLACALWLLARAVHAHVHATRREG